MYEKICPECGSHLDPNERCDCEDVKEKGLPHANVTSPLDNEDHSYIYNCIISRRNSKVKGEPLRDLRLAKNISAKDMVTEVQKLYPKYDKTLQSKCENSCEYGVQLKPDAFDSILEKYAPELLAKAKYQRQGCHRLTHSVSARLEDELYSKFISAITEDGYNMTDGVRQAIYEYVLRKEV